MTSFPQVAHGSCSKDSDCDFIEPPCPFDAYAVCIWKTCYCIGYDQARPPAIPTINHNDVKAQEKNY